MTSARDITASDLIRALGNFAAADEAVRSRAEAAAAALSGEGITTRVFRRGSGRYTVSVTGDNVFGREFGTFTTAAAPFVDQAIDGTQAP